MATQESFEARLTQTHICLRIPWKMKELCRSVPSGRWVPEWRCWAWPRTPRIAHALVETFGKRLTQAVGGAGVEKLAQAAAEQAKSSIPQEKTVDPGSIAGLTTKPWKHQRLAFQFASERPGALLAMGMGTGKTLVALGVILSNGARRNVILCPKSVISVWPSEFAKHTDREVLVAPLNKGNTSTKRKAAQDAIEEAGMRDVPCVIVVNYESARLSPLSDFLLDMRPDTLTLDESHRIKAPGGKASRFCTRLADCSRKVLGLTGTPMPHSPLDLYAQLRAIEPRVFGKNYHRFRQRYAVYGGFEQREVIGFQNQPELREKLYSVTFKADRSVIELPEATHQVIPVDISAKAKKVYAQLENAFWAEVEAGEITVSNALVKLLRLQQLTGGWLKTDDDKLHSYDDAKVKALGDLLEGVEKDEPVVVFCRFRTDLAAVRGICEKLRRKYAELSGSYNDLEEWKAGKHAVLGVQIQSGGIGVDLTRSRYCVYYSLGFSLGDYEQSLCRVHRPGQEHPVIYYHLVATDTVDEDVYKALENRKNVVEHIMNGR